MLIQTDMGIQEKLRILSDAAKYDVSCSSSGVARKGKKGGLGIRWRRGSVTALLRMGGASPF